MFKITVLYNHPVDPESFEKYYSEVHTPIALKIPHLKSFELIKYVETPQGKPDFYRVAHLGFDSAEDMQSALDSAEGQAAAADLGNFATGGLHFLIGGVEKLI
ncbi:MAG TPA: EthD family reductase [Panacibacter sp.]|nr:EthD family reductase [Panacibacter sp.]HNP44875.1 EthD family reductase [Panacibacter sp.]